MSNFTEENTTSLPAGTSTSQEPHDESLHSYGVLVSVAFVWSLVAAVGIVGNAMVILSAMLSKSVRTSTNVFVVNLSVADLWTSLSLPWTSVALVSNGNWPLASTVPCQIAAFMWHTGLGASLYNLALISVNRLVRITRPMSTYSVIFTPRRMAAMVVLSWFIPFFVILFPIAIGVGSLGHDLKHDTCTDDDLHPRKDEYNLAQTVGFYPVPMLTVIVSYLVIYIHIRRHFKKQTHKRSKTAFASTDQHIEVSTVVMTSTTSNSDITGAGMSGSTGDDPEDQRRRHKISRQQLQITKNLFCVFCAFTLCISPYFISLFIPTSEKFALYGATVVILNSCVNPIIYAAKHPQFKPVLSQMMRCRWSSIPNPSSTLQAILAKVHGKE